MNDKKNIKYELILASQSPRRKELLGFLNIPFRVISSDIEELSDRNIPHEFAEDVALQKAQHVYSLALNNKLLKNPFVIASDTIVTKNNTIYGKPRDRDEAKKILLELSGKSHEVITAVAIIFMNQETDKIIQKTFYVSTQVTFEIIAPELLESYLISGDSLDKAGAYGVQGQAQSFIKKLEGSYSNVVGLPVTHLIEELKSVFNKSNQAGFSIRELFLK